jgi:hypothetical protein
MLIERRLAVNRNPSSLVRHRLIRWDPQTLVCQEDSEFTEILRTSCAPH